jgi:hypothetical protein
MRQVTQCIVIWSIAFLSQYSADALPRFALMSGAKCGSCHINPTGGQMRNENGLAFSMDKLALEALRDTDLTFDPKLSENISLGADYRTQFIYDDGTKLTTFHAMTTSIYGAVRLNKKFSFYFKQDILNNTYGSLSGPEVFGIAKPFSGGWYIKGGDFLPDYGWKLDDHTTYTRGGDLGFIPSTGQNTIGYSSGLIFLPNYKDVGVEVGGYVGGFSFSAGLFNGTGNTKKIDFTDQKAYVAKIEYMGSITDVHYRVGASGYGYNGMTMGGFTLGVGTGGIVIMSEVDWTKNYYVATVDQTLYMSTINPGGYSMAAYTEADVQAIQGIWVITRFDMFDPVQGRYDVWTVADPLPDYNSVKRLTVGLEVFPYSFVEIRPQYRFNFETPSFNNDQGLVQMHLWF